MIRIDGHDPLCPSNTHGLLCSCALIDTVRKDHERRIWKANRRGIDTDTSADDLWMELTNGR